MSATLYYEPKDRQRKHISSLFVRRVLETRSVLGPSDVRYLEGIRDIGSAEVAKDAQALLQAIEEHGEIALSLEY